MKNEKYQKVGQKMQQQTSSMGTLNCNSNCSIIGLIVYDRHFLEQQHVCTKLGLNNRLKGVWAALRCRTPWQSFTNLPSVDFETATGTVANC
jgi:hypothetical protein